MYTEIYVNVDLKSDTPEDVIDVLRVMCGDKEYPDDWGYPHRWSYLFNNGSYYTPNTSVAKLTFDNISGKFSLIGKGDIKNYNREIEKFFEFITPWVDGCGRTFIGYHRYEENTDPELVFIN